MTRRPFLPGEVEDFGPELDPTVADLERYLADTAADPSSSFADRVMQAVETEPTPRRGVLGVVTALFTGAGGRGRMALVAATVAVAILSVVAAGELGQFLPSFGGSPEPSPTVEASPEPSPSVVTSPSPSPSPARPSRSPSAEPSATESENASGSPDASDDESETPEPSDDNSGPGGGDDDGGNSGPGGGDDDGGNSGPGGGDDSSGSGSGETD